MPSQHKRSITIITFSPLNLVYTIYKTESQEYPINLQLRPQELPPHIILKGVE